MLFAHNVEGLEQLRAAWDNLGTAWGQLVFQMPNADKALLTGIVWKLVLGDMAHKSVRINIFSSCL